MNKALLCLLMALTVLMGLEGCLETQSSKGYRSETTRKYTLPAKDIVTDSNTVFTVFSTPLPPKNFGARERKQRTSLLNSARISYTKAPDRLENIILYGRRLAGMGFYYEAITVYSTGLESHPSSYKIFRQRGYVYIILRQFDLAIEDLQKAAFYSRPVANMVDEETSTDQFGQTITNEKFNIFFTLGLAHYFKGDYDKTISSFKKCQTYANTNDLMVLLHDWFYLAYRKLGNESAANEIILSITKRTKSRGNVDYINRIMVYKGEFDPETVLSYAENEDNSLTPILAYGVGCWYLVNGEVDRATQVYERILANKAWDTFEYIAAEVGFKSLNNL